MTRITIVWLASKCYPLGPCLLRAFSMECSQPLEMCGKSIWLPMISVSLYTCMVLYAIYDLTKFTHALSIYRPMCLNNIYTMVSLCRVDSRKYPCFSCVYRSFGVLLWEIVTYGSVPLVGITTEKVVEEAQNKTLRHPM